jgi:AbrB family transcriptional regulator (stage V sporulation protein T)
MKATGIVRKIDDLGRVVIPKEIRKNLRIREGDSLEIYIEDSGDIVLKKYNFIEGNMLDIVNKYVEILANETGFSACITDKETVIAVAGTSKSEYLAHMISEHILNIMEERAIWSTKDDNVYPLIEGDNILKYKSQIIAPIICDADAIGSVVLFSEKFNKKITDTEIKLVESTAHFLGKQMEA